MATAAQKRKKRAEQLYKKYGKPLEGKYKGRYVAISSDGKTVLAQTLVDAIQQGKEKLGQGNFVFKVGEQVVGKWL